MGYRAAIITASDSGYAGQREDLSGPAARELLEQAGYEFLTAEVTRIADNTVSLTDEKERFKMQLLLDALEDDDDVQEVAHNWAE